MGDGMMTTTPFEASLWSTSFPFADINGVSCFFFLGEIAQKKIVTKSNKKDDF